MHGDTMTLTRTAQKAVYQLRHGGGTPRFPGKGFSDRDFPSEELGVVYKYPTDTFRPVSDTTDVRAFEMNACMVLLTVGLLLAAVSAVPVADLQDIKPMGDESQEILFAEAIQQQEERGLRFRRVTCDLLSVNLPFGSLNHSACAAHCLSKRKGFKGGRCKDGVCHCRK